MNVIIAAVGGQGALFAARVLGRLAMDNNLDVKASEVHGMSQRGGSVITHVRYGTNISSPIVEEGFADVVLAFELLEGARAVPFLKPGGVIIVNMYRINPLPVLAADADYPADIITGMQKLDATVIPIDASALAKKAGSIRATNAVMLGCLAKRGEFTRDQWLQALKALSPEKSLQSNCIAFDNGFNFSL
jgi:indolepyruvate ferredoxin oxidoreductase beta subunit